jgi:hypothetical protein
MIVQKIRLKGWSLTVFFGVLLSFSAWAQDERKPTNKYVYLKNHFAIGYQSGFNRTQFTLIEGTEMPQSPLAWLQEFQFTYTFQLKHNFGLALRTGTGFYPMVYGYGDKGEVNTPNFLRYMDRISYNNYAFFSPILNYSQWLNKNWQFTSGIGAGIRFFASPSVSSSGQFGPNAWSVSAYYGDQLKTYAFGEFGVNRLLKNQDLIGLKLGYTIGLHEGFSGVYTLDLDGEYSGGLMYNTGSYLNASLTYTFTRARKWAYIEKNFQEEGDSFREAKKQYRLNRNSFTSGPSFIGISGGGSYLYSRASKNDYIRSSHHMSGRGEISAQIGINLKRFIELGVSITGYATGYNIRGNGYRVNSSSNFLEVYEARLGYGFHLNNRKKFYLIDISTGMQLGMHHRSNDDLFSWNQDNEMTYQNGVNQTPNQTMTIEYKDEIQHQVFPLFYLKANRFFLINRSLYFSASAQYNVGFYPITKRYLSYEITGSQPEIGEVIVNMKGTGLQFMFGLNYMFFNK